MIRGLSMKTVTKRKDFTYIVYNEELLRKRDTVMSFQIILYIFIFLYIALFRDNNKTYNYLWIIFLVFFSICYRLESYFSKVEIILYGNKIEIKKGRKKNLYLYSEIKEIKYSEKWIKRVGNLFFIKIMKNDGNIYKVIKGQLKQDIIEIFTTIKDNYEEWRIKNYESCNREN